MVFCWLPLLAPGRNRSRRVGADLSRTRQAQAMTGPTTSEHLRVAGSRSCHRRGRLRPVTSDQMELISADPRVMHGQAVIAGTRVPRSEEHTSELQSQSN